MSALSSSERAQLTAIEREKIESDDCEETSAQANMRVSRESKRINLAYAMTSKANDNFDCISCKSECRCYD